MPSFSFVASKATILPAKNIPVPADKFKESFGESWEQVLSEGRACNAMEACERFKCVSLIYSIPVKSSA